MNRFKKRQEKRRRVYFKSLNPHQIAEIDENGQLVITTFSGYIKKFEPAYYQKSPTFADKQGVDAGSDVERADLHELIASGKPVFVDQDAGVELYR